MRLVHDVELRTRFRAGDREALAIVFDHYAPSLTRWLASGFVYATATGPQRFAGLQSRFDLHDAVAETFRRAFEERSRLAWDGLSAYESYLRGIARNFVIDLLRARGHEAVAPGAFADAGLLDDAAVATAAPPPSPEEAARRGEVARLTAGFLDGLSTEERRFVTLRFEEGRTQLEVAARLRSTRRRVRSLEAAIRRRLAAHLRGTGYGLR
jgi:RNA polymerase sigma factor (sigma-70 family)